MNRSSADIPSTLAPVTEEEGETLRNTIPSMVISGNVTGALRIGPFADIALPVNCRDCGSIPIFARLLLRARHSLRRYLLPNVHHSVDSNPRIVMSVFFEFLPGHLWR